MIKSNFSKVASNLRILTAGTLAAWVSIASAQVNVTTYHNNNFRTGLNDHETTLSPVNVNPAKFGLLFNLPVDGQVYAQPLYLSKLTVAGKGVHNVVFIATEHNSLYAYDADSNTGDNAQPLWHINFGPSVPNYETGSGDISVECGITSTPVITLRGFNGPILYVVSKTRSVDGFGNPVYTQQVHAVAASSGAEQYGGPFEVKGQVPGTGEGSVGGVLKFNPLIQHSRAALLLVEPSLARTQYAAENLPRGQADIAAIAHSILYVAFASHGDNGPYHGWIFVYDADTMTQLGIINTSPNALTDPSGYPIAAGGIWQGGAGPASDGANIFFATGNGTFNPLNKSYGDSIVRIKNKNFNVYDYFTPSNQLNLNDADADLGSGGVMLLPRSASGISRRNFMVQSGKEGTIYLLDTLNMGRYNSQDNIVQKLPNAMGGIWGAPAYFNNTVFFGPIYSSIVAFPIKDGKFTTTSPSAYTPTYFQYPGPTPSVSSKGAFSGIVWAIQGDGSLNGASALHAYDAGNISTELYNSAATDGRDALGGAIKFSTPTIVNGKVYVGTADSVGVFGLGTWAATPTVTPPAGNYHDSVTVTVNDTTPGAVIYYTTDGSNPSPASTLYSGPVTLTTSAAFKARAFVSGAGASATVENDYLINAVIGNGTGLTGAYFNGLQDPSGVPTATELDHVINFNWNGNSPIAGVGGSNWAGEWTGLIQAETTSNYTLTTNSDDGVRVYVNGNLVIDNYGYHAPTYNSGRIAFVAGQKYTIDIKFFQGGGGSVLQLFWNAPGLPFQLVPTSQLYVTRGQGGGR